MNRLFFIGHSRSSKNHWVWIMFVWLLTCVHCIHSHIVHTLKEHVQPIWSRKVICLSFQSCVIVAWSMDAVINVYGLYYMQVSYGRVKGFTSYIASWFVVWRNVICYFRIVHWHYIYLFISNEKFRVCWPLDAIILLCVVYGDGTTISKRCSMLKWNVYSLCLDVRCHSVLCSPVLSVPPNTGH